MNVNAGEGVDFSKRYKVGSSYPVFILTNRSGEEINRWIGYAGGSATLIQTLKSALRDLTPIAQRESRFEGTPTQEDALFLAQHFSESGDYAKSVTYYHRARALEGGKGRDYSLEIFTNTAEAVWNEAFPFDSIYSAADTALVSKTGQKDNTIKVAQLMIRLSRKFNHYAGLKKYLQAAIAITAVSAADKNIHELLQADYALCIDRDTLRAIDIKKKNMGPGWESQRDIYYEYSKWCLDRLIDLKEAETFARKAVDLVRPGMYRARVLGTVAEICEARGKIDEAIKVAQFAIKEDPDNLLYQNLLKRLQDKPARR